MLWEFFLDDRHSLVLLEDWLVHCPRSGSSDHLISRGASGGVTSLDSRHSLVLPEGWPRCDQEVRFRVVYFAKEVGVVCGSTGGLGASNRPRE